MAHRILLAAFATLAVFTVSGCDISTGPQKPAQTTCNCTPPTPPQQAAVPSEPYAPPEHRHRHSWHTAYGGGDHAHGYYWHRSYSEVAVQTYDYHSDSSSTVMGEDDHRGYYHRDGYDTGGTAHGESWVDGYGRHHDGGSAVVGDAAHRETGSDDAARLHPWRGYDVDCPDDDRGPHHHR